MAIEVTHLMGPGARRAGWTNNDGRTYTLQVQVLTGDPTVGPRAALASVGVGAGATYRFPLDTTASEWDYACFLDSISVEETADDGCSWRCDLNYKQYDWRTQKGGDGTGANPSAFLANPLNAPPQVKWSSFVEEVAITHDRSGEPILNKAGDPFVPPLVRPYSTPVATVTRMLASFDPDWINQFKDHVNQAAWCGFPANTVLCREINADRVHDADWGWMWAQTLEFAFRPIVQAGSPLTTIQAGWSKLVLNAGRRQLVSGAVKPILIDNAPVSEDLPLKSDGTYDPAADPVYLTFDVFEEADFSLFDLPTDLFSASAGGAPAGGS